MGLDIVELFLAVEERFGVEIPDEEAEQMRTVGSLHRWLVDKRPQFFATPRNRVLMLDTEPLTEREFTEDEIWFVLLDIVVEQLGVERTGITTETRWVEDLGAD